jgi:hypothetical protein
MRWGAERVAAFYELSGREKLCMSELMGEPTALEAQYQQRR